MLGFSSLEMQSHMDANLSCLNIDYVLHETAISVNLSKHFPEEHIEMNKHKRKLSLGITTRVIKSMKFPDELYKKLKTCAPGSVEHEHNQYSLKIYDGYLNV